MEKVNKITLKFSVDNIEKKFRKEYFDKSIASWRVTNFI